MTFDFDEADRADIRNKITQLKKDIARYQMLRRIFFVMIVAAIIGIAFIVVGVMGLVYGAAATITLKDILDMPVNANYSISGKNWTSIDNITIPCCPSPWYPTGALSPD